MSRRDKQRRQAGVFRVDALQEGLENASDKLRELAFGGSEKEHEGEMASRRKEYRRKSLPPLPPGATRADHSDGDHQASDFGNSGDPFAAFDKQHQHYQPRHLQDEEGEGRRREHEDRDKHEKEKEERVVRNRPLHTSHYGGYGREERGGSGWHPLMLDDEDDDDEEIMRGRATTDNENTKNRYISHSSILPEREDYHGRSATYSSFSVPSAGDYDNDPPVSRDGPRPSLHSSWRNFGKAKEKYVKHQTKQLATFLRRLTKMKH